jgi:hypothetical protein
MASTRKIGVLTFHRSINYGSYWQARCLVEGLRARGHDAELLDHDCKCIRRAEFRCALQPELPARTQRRHLKSYAAKVRKFDEAVASLPLSRVFSLHDPDQTREYETIIVGSDEVWNFRHPWYGSRPIFFGDGLKAERLVSYAASFGNHSAWDGIHPDWARKLNRFAQLSVRDENSWHLVRGGTERKPALVLDPCLQFGEQVPRADAPVEEYAVVYGHGFPAWLTRFVRGWAERRGIRLLSVGYSNRWTDEQLVGCGPAEFARLMAGARAVITNFFHGCIFALLHAKPLAACASDYRAIKIPDLLSILGAGHRLVTKRTPARTIDELLDAPLEQAVAARIEDIRAQSNAYLDAALS